jgi:DtxR family transcriptional regulator, Mn-dependent transcriptional regulator
VPSVTHAVEDYLKAIWKLSHQNGGTKVPVGDIATHLGISAPSVTGMVQKLKGMNLLHYTRYGGVSLTPRGRKIALEIVRHHRLWELYLYTRLGVPLEAVDGEAERLEHVLSDDMEDLLTRALGDPTHDPHGDPIPTKSGEMKRLEGIPLARLTPGATSVVAHVSDRNAEKLRYIVSLGLLPGTRVTVIDRAPFRGPITVRVKNRRHAIDPDLAELVLVQDPGPKGRSGAPRGSGPRRRVRPS